MTGKISSANKIVVNYQTKDAPDAKKIFTVMYEGEAFTATGDNLKMCIRDSVPKPGHVKGFGFRQAEAVLPLAGSPFVKAGAGHRAARDAQGFLKGSLFRSRLCPGVDQHAPALKTRKAPDSGFRLNPLTAAGQDRGQVCLLYTSPFLITG